MIKTDDPSGAAERSGAKTHKCWHREPSATEIRFETGDNGIFLFPLHQKIFAHLTSSSGDEVLTIGFPSHHVMLHGMRLHPILAALQDSAVEWVKPLPPRFTAMVPDGSGIVTKIEVQTPKDRRASE